MIACIKERIGVGKTQTIPELCLNFNELLQKKYINILELKKFFFTVFWSKISIFWDILSNKECF